MLTVWWVAATYLFGLLLPYGTADAGGAVPLAKCDLSYTALLNANGIGKGEWLPKWLSTEAAPPIKKTLGSIKGQEIRSAVLLEYPAFHAGERLSWLFIRTDDAARCWNYVQGKAEENQGTNLNISAFDVLIGKLMSWEQAPPLPEGGPDGQPGGYFAFLSVQEGSRWKQVLLNLHDFKIPLDPQWRDAKPGRVYEAFRPVIELYN